MHGHDEREIHREDAADSRFALQPDLAAQQAGQLAADRKPKASPPVLPAGGAVRLRERLEDLLLLLEGDSDARVDDPERDPL